MEYKIVLVLKLDYLNASTFRTLGEKVYVSTQLPQAISVFRNRLTESSVYNSQLSNMCNNILQMDAN